MSKPIKIFLASSEELKKDRDSFELFISRKNKLLRKIGVVLEVIRWEHFIDAVSFSGLQNEYNKAIKECSIFVMLFHQKVGKFTEEEFETAYGQFKETSTPKIYTYFKDEKISAKTPREELQSLWDFRDRIKEIGHYITDYENIHELNLQFSEQIEFLIDDGYIKATKAQKKTKLGEHHKYSCNRSNQRGKFVELNQEKFEPNDKIRCFYFWGEDKHSHEGLYNRFGLELSNKINDTLENFVDPTITFVQVEPIFLPDTSISTLKDSTINLMLTSLSLDKNEIGKINKLDLGAAIKRSKKFSHLMENDIVMMMFALDELDWDEDMIPIIARDLIEDLAKNTSADAPTFYFFFSIEFGTELSDEKKGDLVDSIKRAMKKAQYTKEIPALSKVNERDIKRWFRKNKKFWKTDDPVTDYFGEIIEEMFMKDVEMKLGKFINSVNDEKNKHRNPGGN